MYIKNIQILFTFISLSLIALSSPISYGDDGSIINKSSSNNPINRKYLMVRNDILDDDDDNEEVQTLSFKNNDEEENFNDFDYEFEKISNGIELDDKEKESEDTDFFSFNWNFTQEDSDNVSALVDNMNKIIAQIVQIPDDECSFESIIVPLEQKVFGPAYNIVYPLYMMSYFHPNKEIRESSEGIGPSIMLQKMNIYQNPILYQKILKVKENIEKGIVKKPEAIEDQRLIDLYELEFRRNGAALSTEQIEEFNNITTEIFVLSSQFGQCLINDNSTISFTEEELEGVPDLSIFEKSIKDGKEIYTVDFKGMDVSTIISYAKNEETRKSVMIMDLNNCPSNIEILKRILQLRLRKANLLGYPDFATYQIENKMAKTPETVVNFLENIKEKTQPIFFKQLKELLEIKKKEKEDLNETFDNKINVWDIYYYSRIKSENDHGYNSEEVKKYFPYNETLLEVLNVYETLLSVKCVEVKNPSVWDPTVRVFNVYDKTNDNKFMGAIYLDLYVRDGKSSGVTIPLNYGYEKEDGSRTYPTVAVLLNYIETNQHFYDIQQISILFHELGHAFHLISTNVKWVTNNEINYDFAETPSQLMEVMIWEPEILKKLSHHYQDGSKIPEDLIKSIVKEKNVNTVYYALDGVALSIFDLKIHSLKEIDDNIDILSIFTEEYEDTLSIKITDDNNFPGMFGHIINGYESFYYSYLWSQVYSFDIFSKIKEKGVLNPEIGLKYRNIVLRPGASRDAMDLLKEFLGREPNDKAFIKNISS